MKKHATVIVLVALIIITLIGCSSTSPKISEDRIKEDLLTNGIWIASWMERASGLSDISYLEITKSQTEEKSANYWIIISYKWADGSGGGEKESAVIRYEKFDQGWQFVRGMLD